MKIAQMQDEGLDYTSTYKLYEQYLEQYNSEVDKYNCAIEKAKEAEREKEEKEKREKEDRESTNIMIKFFVVLFGLIFLIVFLASYNNGCI